MGCFELRYKRLVRQVYPVVPGEGINSGWSRVHALLLKLTLTAALNHLTWYALHTPKKLRMIARTLQARITRDLRLLATENVQVGMTAFDKLMQTCHGHMDMIIKAYLVVLEQLLDARDATYPVLAANSVL